MVPLQTVCRHMATRQGNHESPSLATPVYCTYTNLNLSKGLTKQVQRARRMVLPEPPHPEGGNGQRVSDLRKLVSLGTICKHNNQSSASSTNFGGRAVLDVRLWMALTATAAEDLDTSASDARPIAASKTGIPPATHITICRGMFDGTT